jgi:hypothetical protein
VIVLMVAAAAAAAAAAVAEMTLIAMMVITTMTALMITVMMVMGGWRGSLHGLGAGEPNDCKLVTIQVSGLLDPFAKRVELLLKPQIFLVVHIFTI